MRQEQGKGGTTHGMATRIDAPVAGRTVPEALKDPKKKPLIQKLGENLAVRVALAGTALAGAGVVAYETIPQFQEAVHKTIGLGNGEVQILPYNPTSSKPQEIQTGPNGNARPITPEEIQTFINRVPPVFEETKSGEQAPKIKVVLSVDPEQAKQVRVTKSAQNTLNGSESYYYDNLHIQIQGDNAPFSIPLIEGAKKVYVKTFINAGGISYIELSYHFNNGQIKHAWISFGDYNFTPTDVTNDIPTYKPKDLNGLSFEARNALPAKEFDLEKNPSVGLFYPKGTTDFAFILNVIDPYTLSPSLDTAGGDVLYLPSTP